MKQLLSLVFVLLFSVGAFCDVTFTATANANSSDVDTNPGVSIVASSKPNLIFFITGGVRSHHIHPEVAKALNLIAPFIQLKAPHDEFLVYHNSKSAAVCSFIKDQYKKQTYNKLILIGHSYGGSASNRIGYCLDQEKIPVDAFICLDAIKRPQDGNPELVPDNIQHVYNYFQNADLILKGRKNLRRLDGSHAGIINTYVKMPRGTSPHNELVFTLAVEGFIQTNIADELQYAH